jgi:hypothetical protein
MDFLSSICWWLSKFVNAECKNYSKMHYASSTFMETPASNWFVQLVKPRQTLQNCPLLERVGVGIGVAVPARQVHRLSPYL